MINEATFDACVDALMKLTPYSEESVNEALRDLAEEFPGRCWDPIDLLDAVQDWVARETVRQNLAAGMFEPAGYGADGEQRYRVTEAGRCRVEAMLRGTDDDR